MATKKDPFDELVSFIAHKDADRYAGDIVAGVNGKTYKIKRGVRVEIPKPVYDVIMHSMEADAHVADEIMEAEEKANKGVMEI